MIFSSSRRGGRRQLWRIGASGSGKPTRLVGVGENTRAGAISLRGHLLAYERWSESASLWKIPIKPGKGGAPVRVTSTIATDKFPHYSPDGKRITFCSSRSGVHEIWIYDAD